MLALIVALGGIGIAAIPGKDGVVHACYAKKTGDVRLVEKGKKCKRGEKKTTWNQKGRTGATGQIGPIGPQGLKGDKGDKGDPGQAGTNGENGIDGSAGQAGSSGPGILFTSGSVPNNTTNYVSLAGATSGDEVTAQSAIPPGATLTARDLAVRVRQNVAAAVQVNFRVNGATQLDCTIQIGQNSCSSTQTTSLVPGALVNYRLITTADPGVQIANLAVRIVF